MSELWIHQIKPLSVADDESSTLVFAGDFVLRRGGDWRGMLDEKMTEVFSGAEYVGVNMEAPIEGVGHPIEKVGPVIAMDKDAPECLRFLGVDWVSFANNHAMDFGDKAMLATKQGLIEKEISVVGAGENESDAHRVHVHELKNGVKVALISVCEYEFGITEGSSPGAAWVGNRRVLEGICQAKSEGCFVVVCSHGGVEEVPLPPVERQKQLRGFIDAGADLIIGHHPHVPQGWEIYQGKMIFYSLGDFVFDLENTPRKRWRDWGYCVRVSLNNTGGVGVELIGYERVEDKIICLGGDRDPEKCWAYLQASSDEIVGGTLSASWGAMAEDLMDKRYGPFLESIFTKVAEPKSIRTAMSCLTSAIKNSIKVRLGLAKPSQGGIAEMDNYHRLLLLNLLRCESHKWSILRSLSAENKNTQNNAKTRHIIEAMTQL